MTFESGATRGLASASGPRARGRKQLRGSHTKRVHGRTAFERAGSKLEEDGYVEVDVTIAVAGLVAVGSSGVRHQGIRQEPRGEVKRQRWTNFTTSVERRGADEERTNRHQRRRPESAGGGERGESGRSSRPRADNSAKAPMRGPNEVGTKADELDKGVSASSLLSSERDEGQFKFGQDGAARRGKAKIDDMIQKLMADPNGAWFEIEGHDANRRQGDQRRSAWSAPRRQEVPVRAVPNPAAQDERISYGSGEAGGSNKTKMGVPEPSSGHPGARVTGCTEKTYQSAGSRAPPPAKAGSFSASPLEG